MTQLEALYITLGLTPDIADEVFNYMEKQLGRPLAICDLLPKCFITLHDSIYLN
jgi:hypothetical protein